MPGRRQEGGRRRARAGHHRQRVVSRGRRHGRRRAGRIDPRDRLPAPIRAGVDALSGAVRQRWQLAGRGRYSIGPGFISNGRLRLGGPGRIRIGDDCNAWARAETNVLLTFAPGALIEIGNNVRLNGAGIQAATRVTVGDDCILGSCTIVDTDHHPVAVERRHQAGPVATAPIVIGRNVWVAGMAAVLKGVTIGDDSVVAFGAVVASDVPAGVVVAGNPARVVKNLYDETH